VTAHTYGNVGEQELSLPYWNYATSTAMNTTSAHTTGTGASALSFTFHNFALLHGDGDFAGRVIEARADPAGIAVELRRCVTYTEAGDGPDNTAGTEDDVDETCREETDFDAQTTSAAGSGRWDFGSLREGWYVVNIAATTYNRAKFDDDGIDDDAATCDGSATATSGDPNNPTDGNCDTVRTDDVYGMLEGKRAFNRGGATFYVYNDRLDSDAAATDVEVEGTANIDAGETTLATVTSVANDDGPGSTVGTITWASGTITITPDIPARATFTAKVMDGTKVVSSASGEDGDDVSLTLRANKTNANTGAPGATTDAESTVEMTVTAENGYNDTEFSFIVTRTNPVDAQLGGLVLGDARGGANGVTHSFDAAEDEQSATVAAGSGTGTTMSVFIAVTAKALQKGLEVRHNGNVLTALSPQSTQGALVHHYRITVPRTGSLQGHVLDIEVTSEDNVDHNYQITLER